VKFDLSDLTVLRFGTTEVNTQTNVSAKIRLIWMLLKSGTGNREPATGNRSLGTSGQQYSTKKFKMADEKKANHASSKIYRNLS